MGRPTFVGAEESPELLHDPRTNMQTRQFPSFSSKTLLPRVFKQLNQKDQSQQSHHRNPL